MAVRVSNNVLDNGLLWIKNNCSRMVALKDYTPGGSYATVTAAGNILASVAMSPTDLTITSSGSGRVITSASGKIDLSSDATGIVTHIAFLDDSGADVLWVTEETSGLGIVAGKQSDFPSLSYYSEQIVEI